MSKASTEYSIDMGTCMTKDKKGPTVEGYVTQASLSSSPSSSSSRPEYSLTGDIGFTSNPEMSEKNSEGLSMTTISRYSIAESPQQTLSTDKYVMEILQPISPNKLKASICSATLAARDMDVTSMPVQVERCSEVSSVDSSEDEKVDAEERVFASGHGVANASRPFQYPNYLHRLSFSRDIAAFSRDIACLSVSPIVRPSSFSGAHDFFTSAIKAASLNPQSEGHAKSHLEFASDRNSSARSRSLPKRFYGKESLTICDTGCRNSRNLQRRSSSRDRLRLGTKPGSPRFAVRREAALVERRVKSRKDAASARRNGFAHINPEMKELSSSSQILNCNSTLDCAPDIGKLLARGDPAFRENSNFLHKQMHIRGGSWGREVLKDKSNNCNNLIDSNSYASIANVKAFSCANITTPHRTSDSRDDNNGKGTFHSCNGCQQHKICYKKAYECQDSLDAEEKPALVENDQSLSSLLTHQVEPLNKAVAEKCTDFSPLPGFAECETDMEGELDLIHFAFGTRLLLTGDLEAQQYRNRLLKEAAMDAFARPRCHSNDENILGPKEEKQVFLSLSDLISMNLTDSEALSSRIREVLALLSAAECEMEDEQKALFYNQLQKVLDSLKVVMLAKQSRSQGEECASSIAGESVNARVNSWLKTAMGDTHTVTSVRDEDIKEMNYDMHRDLSMNSTLCPDGEQASVIGLLVQQLSSHQHISPLHEKISDTPSSEFCEQELIGDIIPSSGDEGMKLGIAPFSGTTDLTMTESDTHIMNEEDGYKSDMHEFPELYMAQTGPTLNKETQFSEYEEASK